MAGEFVLNLDGPAWKETIFEKYANYADIKELLERKHPYTFDRGIKCQNFSIYEGSQFWKVRAPEQLTQAEVNSLYEQNSQRDQGLSQAATWR